jgi:hypothetical protein
MYGPDPAKWQLSTGILLYSTFAFMQNLAEQLSKESCSARFLG